MKHTEQSMEALLNKRLNECTGEELRSLDELLSLSTLGVERSGREPKNGFDRLEMKWSVKLGERYFEIMGDYSRCITIKELKRKAEGVVFGGKFTVAHGINMMYRIAGGRTINLTPEKGSSYTRNEFMELCLKAQEIIDKAK